MGFGTKKQNRLVTMGRTFILSDESVNGYGYRVLTSGLAKEQFLRNPVMLYSHNDCLLPIGTWENIREDGDRLLADAKFDERDAFAQEVCRKVDEGILRCCSIGFNVLGIDESEELKMPGQVGPTVTKAELLECSICAVGANRNAMRLSADPGMPLVTVRTGARMTLTKTQGDNPSINLNSLEMTEQEKQQMEQLQNQVAQLTNEKNTLTEERDNALAEVKKVRDAEIETLLSAAVSDGRINESEKETWREMLSVTPESAKAALAKLNPRTILSQVLEQGKGKGEFAGKSWKELDREGKLSAFKIADPEGFKALYRSTFGADYKE